MSTEKLAKEILTNAVNTVKKEVEGGEDLAKIKKSTNLFINIWNSIVKFLESISPKDDTSDKITHIR